MHHACDWPVLFCMQSPSAALWQQNAMQLLDPTSRLVSGADEVIGRVLQAVPYLSNPSLLKPFLQTRAGAVVQKLRHWCRSNQ